MITTYRTAARLLALALAAAPIAAAAQMPEASPPPVAAAPMVAPPAAPAPSDELRAVVGAAADALPVSPAAPTAAILPSGLPIRLDGELWIDTGAMLRKNGESGKPNQNTEYMQGRFILGAAWSHVIGGVKAEVRGEFLALENDKATYEPHSQDVYLRVGQASWDVQIGRYLAWEVFKRGLGMDYYTADEAGAFNGPTMYRVNLVQGRSDEPGQAAAHWYPAPGLGLEVTTVFGSEGSQNQLGARPTVVYSIGPVDLVAGGEILRQQPQYANDKVKVTSYGGGGRAQLRIPHVTCAVEAARMHADAKDINGDTASDKTLDKASYGAFANLDFGPHTVGVGGFFTEQKNKLDERPTHTQAFLAYQLQTPVTGLSVKAVAGYAKAHVESATAHATASNDMKSFRIRLDYVFN